MKILALRLKNFKGIKSFELNTQGKDANIYGDNGTGKTTRACKYTLNRRRPVLAASPKSGKAGPNKAWR
mgnify:CR=1 FL=1